MKALVCSGKTIADYLAPQYVYLRFLTGNSGNTIPVMLRFFLLRLYANFVTSMRHQPLNLIIFWRQP
jgi:hypothetical protein